MAWDLETAKQYLGIVDDTQDAVIQQALDTVLATVELHLQRKLILDRASIEFLNIMTNRLIMPRFPIVQVYTIDGELVPDDYTIHHAAGWITLPNTRFIDSMVVDYEGGFAQLPLGLERVMWEAFMVFHGSTNPDTGGPSQGAVTTGEGEIKSLTVFDGFKMDFNVADLSGDASGSAERELMWGWLAPWASVLEMYRSEHGIGVGMA